MKHDLDARERGCDGDAVAYVSLDELGGRVNPRGSPVAMRVRLKVIEYAHAVAFSDEQVNDVRADESRAARHQSAPPVVSNLRQLVINLPVRLVNPIYVVVVKVWDALAPRRK